MTDLGLKFKKIAERNDVRGNLAKYVVSLMADYFDLCSTAVACTKEKALKGLSDRDARERLDEEKDEAVAKAEALEPIIVELYDLVVE
jgi:hypothetical protein